VDHRSRLVGRALPVRLKPDTTYTKPDTTYNWLMAGRIHEEIVTEVSSWPGVETRPHRFGGVEFRVGRRELGHLHGDRLADLPFPVRVREQLVAAGKAAPHHILPESGWVSRYIRSSDDVAEVVALFRLNYERPWMPM
jgi:luciferase-like monooxygenase